MNCFGNTKDAKSAKIMQAIPEVGEEYDYLGVPVTVDRVVPCEGGSPADATVEFFTRLGHYGDCLASELTPRRRPLEKLRVPCLEPTDEEN